MNSETQQWIDETRDFEGWRTRVREALKEKRMSQAKFARLCGCSASNISNLLNGYVAPVPKYIWQRAKEHLNV